MIMKKTFVCFTCPVLTVIFGFSTTRTTIAIPQKATAIVTWATREVRNAEHAGLATNFALHNGKRREQNELDKISVNDLLFFNGNTRIDVLSITQAKVRQLFGKPKRIEKGYSEVDDDDTVTYIYPDGEIMFLVKRKFWYIDVKGAGWAFGIKGKDRTIAIFSPGNTLAMLKKLFPHSFQHSNSTSYVSLGIKTSSGILSDSGLTFEVNKSGDRIVSMYLN
jgi:hypothetical protein